MNTLAHTQQALDNLATDLDIAHERLKKLILDWNELCGVLDKKLGCQLSGQLDGTWTVVYDGKASSGHKSVSAAYKKVIEDRLGTQ